MAAEKLDTRTRQDQIAKAALKVIAACGLNAVSIAAVAEAIGLVPSAIYRHFKGREEMVTAALQLIGRALHDNVAAAKKEGKTPLQQLHRVLERHVALLAENPGIPRLVFSEEVFAQPPHRQAIYESIRAYLDEVAALLREAQRDGEVREDLDPETGAALFLGLIQPGAILWQMSHGRFDFQGHAERGWEVLVCAWRKNPQP